MGRPSGRRAVLASLLLLGECRLPSLRTFRSLGSDPALQHACTTRREAGSASQCATPCAKLRERPLCRPSGNLQSVAERSRPFPAEPSSLESRQGGGAWEVKTE